MKNLKDLARIAYILENYDTAEYKGEDSGYRNSNGSKGRVIAFCKRVNGYYSVFEVVFNSKSRFLKVKPHIEKSLRNKSQRQIGVLQDVSSDKLRPANAIKRGHHVINIL